MKSVSKWFQERSLHSNDMNTRIAAIEKLAVAGEADSEPLLLEALNDASMAVRTVAAGALGHLGAQLIGRSPDISFWTRVAAFAAGLVFIAIVGFIPVLGPLAIILATAAGLGALLLQIRNAGRPAVE